MNAIFQPDIKNPRPIKIIVWAALILGQLFVSGIFFNAAGEVSISSDSQAFFDKAALIGVASALLMLPLKLFISFFLSGKVLNEKMKESDLEASERMLPYFRLIGFTFVSCWLGVCLWGISMFVMSFCTSSMEIWMFAFLLSFLTDQVIIFNLKVLVTVLLGILLLQLGKYKCMLSIASSCAGVIVDFILQYI